VKRKRPLRLNRLNLVINVTVIFSVLGFIAYMLYKVDEVLEYHWQWDFIPGYIIHWDESEGHWVPNLLLKGLFTTCRLVIWSMLVASLIGIVMGIMRTSERLFFRMISRLYVEFVRNMPPVVFIFIFYFFISSQLVPILGIDEISVRASPATLAVLEWVIGPPELFSNVISGIFCLAIFEAAYITEIVRAGIQSIDRGQVEAGQSTGLSRLQLMRWVVLPQAIHRMLPPLAGQFITLIKDSSIVALISIQELTFLAREVAVSTMHVFEIWIFVAGMYFCICYLLAILFNRMEKRISVYRA